jgi:uncharacterized membrane protein HdeD (DUF308 family)
LQSWTALSHRHDRDNWGVLLLGGLVGIGIGLLTWFAPGITTLGLLFYIAIWAITTGVLELVVALRLRKQLTREWLLIMTGVLSILFGVAIIVNPGAGALAIVTLIGIYALVIGAILMGLSFRLRGFGHRIERHQYA